MTKKIIFVAIAIVVIIFAYFAYNYFICTLDKGKPCSPSAFRDGVYSDSGIDPLAGVNFFPKRIICNFFTGKKCE